MPEPEKPDLSTGGLVAVILGEGGDVPVDYAYHKQVLPLQGWLLDTKQLDSLIPANTKAVVIGGAGARIPRHIYESVHELLRKRRTPYQTRTSTAAVKDALDNLFPRVNRPRLTESDRVDKSQTPQETAAAHDKQVQQARGSVKAFIERHAPDIRKRLGMHASHADMGRELFKLAQRETFTTTLGSLMQGVRLWSREQQRGTVPQSVLPEPVKTRGRIEHAITLSEQQTSELKACLTYIHELEAENERLTKIVNKAKEVFAAFGGDVFGAA